MEEVIHGAIELVSLVDLLFIRSSRAEDVSHHPNFAGVMAVRHQPAGDKATTSVKCVGRFFDRIWDNAFFCVQPAMAILLPTLNPSSTVTPARAPTNRPNLVEHSLYCNTTVKR